MLILTDADAPGPAALVAVDTESCQAWRRAQPDLGEELVDVALYLFALAETNAALLDDAGVTARTIADGTSRETPWIPIQSRQRSGYRGDRS